MYLEPGDFKSLAELEAVLNGPNAERYYIQVDSVMCFGTLREMKEKFSMLQLYLISKNLKQIKESTGAASAVNTAIAATGWPMLKLCPMNRVRNPCAPSAAAVISIKPINNVAGPGHVRICVVEPTGVKRNTT
jgi:hypothetical protein